MQRQFIQLLLFLVLGAVASFMLPAEPSVDLPLPPSSPTPLPAVEGVASESARVVRVIDGDTVELDSGEKLRYIGIDTPETVAPNQPVGCFGKEATTRNRELVEGREVQLEMDVKNTDRYGRLLRYVYIDDVMINELLVQEGFAISNAYPPDIKYQDRFDAAQLMAQQAAKGLWGETCASNPK